MKKTIAPLFALTACMCAPTSVMAQSSPNLPTFLTPFRSFSGQFVGITIKRWAGVVGTPYAEWPVHPFKFLGHNFTGVSLEADLLAGAIVGPNAQFTAGQEFGGHYSWHPGDYVGLGVAQLYQNTLKPIYRPFFEVGWNF